MTDFQVEIPGQTETRVNLFLPKGFTAERIEIAKKKLTAWESTPGSDQFSEGTIIPVRLHSDRVDAPITVRVSGHLNQKDHRRVSTTFPRLVDAIQMHAQMTVVVEAPLRTTDLSTRDLYQIDARVGPGIRDAWSFAVDGINPSIDISIDIPVPRLQVEQLVMCGMQQKQVHELKYFMFWKTDEEGLFTAKFNLISGYEVEEILILSQANQEVPFSWNLRTEQDRRKLLIHLSNEMVPGQKLSVSITLRPRSSGNRQTRITIPALKLINGDLLEDKLLITQSANLKPFPHNAPLKKIPLDQIRKWASVWKELSIVYSDPEHQWLCKDISLANRILIKTDTETDKLINPQAIPLPGDAITPPATQGQIKQIFPPRTDWKGVIKAIWHRPGSRNPKIQIEYKRQTEQGQPFPSELEFPDEITLDSVIINGQSFVLESTGRHFQLPDSEGAIESLIVTYSTTTLDSLPLPAIPFPVSYDQILLCLPSGKAPRADNSILFWQKLQKNYYARLEVDPAFVDNLFVGASFRTPQTVLDSLISDYVFLHNYTLFEAHPNDHRIGDRIQLAIGPGSGSIPWYFLFWAFTAVLSFSLFVNVLVQHAHLGWIVLAVLFSAVSVLYDQYNLRLMLFPVTAALFLAAQLPGQLLNQFIGRQKTEQDRLSKPGGTLRHLLGTSCGILLMLLWLHASVSNAQSDPETASTVRTPKPDLLIPVKTALLTEKFRGLQPAQYPDIIYLSESVAKKIKELESTSRELNEILFHRVNYDALWTEQGVLRVHCRFEIIDTRAEDRNSFILPLTSIDSLPELKAIVNGRSASITPLPDGSGLEIPLPDREGDEKNDQRIRRYQIELDVIPQNRILENGIRFTLGIPPVAQCQMAFQFPEKFKARLFPSSQKMIELLSGRGNGRTYYVGAIRQMELVLDTANDINPGGKQKPYDSFQTSMFAEISPSFLSLRLQMKVEFPENGQRTVKWQLPRGMAVRSVHALSHIEYRLEPLSSQRRSLALKFPDTKTNKQTVVVDLIMPFDSDGTESATAPIDVQLPSLVYKSNEADFEQQWQIALQSPPGYELSDVDFPSINTSRITPAVFNQNWFGKKNISNDALCFRLEKPERFKVKLRKRQKELTVIADQRVSVQFDQVHLSSRYQIDVIDEPLWTMTIEKPIDWELISLQVESRNTILPIRVMKQKKRILVAFAERIDDACFIKADWRMPLEKKMTTGKSPIRLKITPPRIPQTLYYRENLKTISESSNYRWLVEAIHEQKTAASPSPSASPATQLTAETAATTEAAADDPLGKESVEIDADDISEMPAIFIRKSETEKTTPLQEKSQASPDQNAEPKTERQKKKNPTNSTQPLQIEMDHTVWQEKKNWSGETLILIPISELEKHLQNKQTVQISIPKQTRIVRLLHHEALTIDAAEKEEAQKKVIVHLNTEVENRNSTDRFALIMIQWTRPRVASWETVSSLPLPNSSQRTSVSWRLIDSRPRDRTLSRTKQAWKTYLLILSELGQSDINRPVSPVSLPGQTPSLFKQILTQLPEQRERKVISALGKLPELSWNYPLPFKLTRVAETGRSNSPLEKLEIPSNGNLLRYAILLLLTFWSWGMWQINRARQSRVKKRDLGFASFLLIGLLATLVIY